MEVTKASWMISILVLGLVFSAQSIGSVVNVPAQEGDFDQPFTDAVRHFALQDGVCGIEENNMYYTEPPSIEPLEVHSSSNRDYQYMADSPYYTVFFNGPTMRMEIGEAWIELELVENDSEEVQTGESTSSDNELSVSDVLDSVDMEYEVDTSLLTGNLVLSEFKECERFVYEISWGGMTPEYTEDGSLLFSSDGTPVVEILPPFMKDNGGSISTDVHYDLVKTETGYELHKVIDAAGRKWLESAQYPVIIDPSMQTFEDAWQSSGLSPFGQYFQNLKEFVNPATGYLTVVQTDLIIPGRGLNLGISRVYETPAVFYGSDPYDYEAPPVDVGKAWQLDFPYVGSKYLHLWGGTVYKIEWSGNTYENHKGGHFKLVKNGDNTYTLITAGGIVYEFNTSGSLTHIKDLDQNTITLTYSSGTLTTITDTIGRTVSLTYESNRLDKITYNNLDIEFSYDANGCLVSMKDFLNRETKYYYASGNKWLLNKIEYITSGYTTYTYSSFSDNDYYKYHVEDQKVFETNQVRYTEYSYTGSFSAITSSLLTMHNESDVVKGYCGFTINGDGLITQKVVKNASETPIRKFTYTYDSKYQTTETSTYKDGSTLSYTVYYAYDNWGNVVYHKNPEGYEQFASFANTNTSGFFVDNTGTIIKIFTNAFSNSTVPASVHNAVLGMAEKQDNTYVKEVYVTYDGEAHPTESDSLFGDYTSYETFSGTFNENTGSTSFSIDLTGYTAAGNAVLQITGLASDPTYTETHSYTPDYQCQNNATWSCVGWIASYFKVNWVYSCGQYPDLDIYQGLASIGPFTHKPDSLGYQSYSTNPACDQQAYTFYVTTNWKAYPAQVQYDVNGSNWKLVSSNLANTTAQVAVTSLTNGENTLYFSESSAQNTKFSWSLYVPVDNSPDTYTTSMQYDTYGNVTSITDAESNTVTFTHSSSYSYAYLTEISATAGNDTITTKATYDYYRGWITSTQEPKGVASSGYDYLYTYDVLGRVTKKEFPLLTGQSQRTYMEAIYDDTNRKVTIINQQRHYMTQHYDKLGRLTDTKLYTGTYGQGTLFSTESYTYNYNSLISTATDAGNDTYSFSYDILGRCTQITSPDSVSVYYVYDDTNNKATFTNARGYDTVHWFDWLNRLKKVEEEYATDSFAVTTYQYDQTGHLTSFTDAENHTTTYEYTSLFGLTKTIYPDSEYGQFQYDDVGNVTSFIDCNGDQTAYTYDSMYRLTQIEYEDQSTVTFTYDLNGNRTKMEDDAPNTGDYVEYTYDKWNRLTTQTRHISTSTYAVSCEYDVANRLTTLTYPDNMQILYSYDDLNRIIEIKRYVDGSNDEVLMDNVQYSTENLLTQFDYGNDLQATFSYDSENRLLTINIKDDETSYLDLDYTLDDNNNVTQLVNGWRDTSSTWHSETESYSYDGLDRLTSASCTSWSHTYSYDKVGNRTAKDSVTYTVNTVNEVTALSDGTSFTYDDNGNRTQKTKGTDTWDYTFDYMKRLTKVEKNQTTLGEYIYDGYGRRLQKTEDSTTKTYIYAGGAVLYEETSIGTACYAYGPTGTLAKRTTINQESNTFFFHKDRQGSNRVTTDDNKNIVSAAAYHPFGESSTEEGSENYLFSGKEKDSTGLYYFGARYYDPDTGRWISRDYSAGNMKEPMSLNRYTYCYNNPLQYIDPDGLDPYSVDINGLVVLGVSNIPVVGGALGSILGWTYSMYWSVSQSYNWHHHKVEVDIYLHGNIPPRVGSGAGHVGLIYPKFAAYVTIPTDDPVNVQLNVRNDSNCDLYVFITHNGTGHCGILVSGKGNTFLSMSGSGAYSIWFQEGYRGHTDITYGGSGPLYLFFHQSDWENRGDMYDLQTENGDVDIYECMYIRSDHGTYAISFNGHDWYDMGPDWEPGDPLPPWVQRHAEEDT
ncbi:MAG: RHS repeat-associated core domain-containing protein [Candidatus Methanofastidiosia archaeon]